MHQEMRKTLCSLIKSYLSGSQASKTIQTPMAPQKSQRRNPQRSGTHPPSLGGTLDEIMATIGNHIRQLVTLLICVSWRWNRLLTTWFHRFKNSQKLKQHVVWEKRGFKSFGLCTNNKPSWTCAFARQNPNHEPKCNARTRGRSRGRRRRFD